MQWYCLMLCLIGAEKELTGFPKPFLGAHQVLDDGID